MNVLKKVKFYVDVFEFMLFFAIVIMLSMQANMTYIMLRQIRRQWCYDFILNTVQIHIINLKKCQCYTVNYYTCIVGLQICIIVCS